MKPRCCGLLILFAVWLQAVAQISGHSLPDGLHMQYDFSDNGVNYAILYRRVSDNERRMTDTVTVRQGSKIPLDGRIVIPSDVEFGGRMYVVGGIDSDAFANCTELKSVSLPPSMTFIGGKAFADCSNLEEIDLPEGVREIGIWAFRNCRKLVVVDLPVSVSEIGDGAFDNAGVKRFGFHHGLESVNGWWAFGFDHSLDYISLPECVNNVCDLKSKVIDYNGSDLKFSHVVSDLKCNSLLLHTSTPFCPWPDDVKDYQKKYLLKFARGCTVYVPDDAVEIFRTHPEWKQFKAVKPLSDYKK